MVDDRIKILQDGRYYTPNPYWVGCVVDAYNQGCDLSHWAFPDFYYIVLLLMLHGY